MAVKSKFYKIYRICVIAFVCFLTAALTVLFFWLREYENSMPANTALKIAQKYIAAGDADYLIENCGMKISPYENRDILKETLKGSAVQGEITVSTASAKDADCDAAFSVKSGDKKIATVYLKRDTRKKALGNRGYTAVSCTLDNSLYKSVKISMPSNAQVYINGILLADDARTDSAVPEIDKNIFDMSSAVKKQTAQIENLLAQPTVTAKQDGADLNVSGADGEFCVEQSIDDGICQKIGATALEGAKTYAKFMQNDAGFSAVAKYLKSGTSFYKNLRTSLVIFAIDHDSYGFEDVSVTEYYKYSDKLYSCRVTFTQVLKKGNQQFRDTVDKNVFVIAENGGYKIVDMQSVSDKK